MDKHSILADALAYLKGILDETEKEMERENGNTNSPTSSCTTTTTTEYDMPNHNHSAQAKETSNKMPHTMSEIDAEMIDEQSFVLKIRFGIGAGAAAQVQRVIESLRLDIISTTINQINEHEMLSTTLLSVKKKVAITEEKLKDRVELISRKMGILYLDV